MQVSDLPMVFLRKAGVDYCVAGAALAMLAGLLSSSPAAIWAYYKKRKNVHNST